jgi:NitT/TauT family transport system ATP-binding protein
LEIENLIIFNNVSHSFFDEKSKLETYVLKNISLSIQSKTITSILGLSGSGKTTILKLIAGLLKPTTGEVLYNNLKVSNSNFDRTIIFQDYALFEWKTVRENIEFGLIAKNIEIHKRIEIINNLLNITKLQKSADKYPKELSGGMRQRVAIARALAVEPNCILMDEPFSALDQITRLELQNDILTQWENKKQTILLVTHNIEEALYLSDRILVIGGSPSQILMDLTINLSRPRSLEMLSLPLFNEYKSEIFNVIKTQIFI